MSSYKNKKILVAILCLSTFLLADKSYADDLGDLTSYVEASKDNGEVLEDEKVEEDKSDEGLVFP